MCVCMQHTCMHVCYFKSVVAVGSIYYMKEMYVQHYSVQVWHFYNYFVNVETRTYRPLACLDMSTVLDQMQISKQAE